MKTHAQTEPQVKAAHTPGPWHYREDRVGISRETRWFVFDSEPGGETIAELPDFRHSDNAANARLIAAAPDLLAALKYCNEILDRECIRAAISKAEGTIDVWDAQAALFEKNRPS